MALSKFIWFLFVISCHTFSIALAQQNARPISLIVTEDFDEQENQLRGLYVKDNKNSELRSLFDNNSNFNNRINQLITQQQDFLEQLRPTAAASTNPIVVNLANGAVSSTGLNTASTAGTASTNPVVINLSGSNGVSSGNNNNQVIASLLPQIVGQAVLNRRVRPNGNRRRRRRPVVQVIRP